MKPKLIGLFVLTGIIPLVVLGIWCSKLVGDSLIERSYGQLEAVREIKKAQIQRFFEDREGDMGVLVETVKTLTQNAFKKFKTNQTPKKAYLEDYFRTIQEQLRILKDDPFVLKALDEFNSYLEESGNDVSDLAWGRLAQEYDLRMKDIMKINKWYDIYLIGTNGDIVYTINRGTDLGMNLMESKLKDSGLGKAFQAVQNMEADEIWVSDFEPYEPAGGRYAAFMIAQIQDKYGFHEVEKGYIAFRMPTDKINTIMQQREGMGETGETYLVGKWEEKTAYRSDRIVKTARLGDEKTGSSVAAALAGESGKRIKTGSTGQLEVEMYAPLDIPGLHWAIISTQGLEEIVATKLEEEEEDFFAKYIQKYGYYDLFLIHSEGTVFYSVTHEADYGTNMISGKYRDSGLGKLVQYVLETKQFTLADFEPYAPRQGTPAAFIAQPILDQKNEVQFIVALQLTMESINNIMEQREGMGETGETYLVGSDMLMRSNSYNDKTNRTVTASFANPDKGSVETMAVEKALTGASGTEVITNYNDKPVLSAYAPMIVGDTTWAMIAEIEEAEVKKPITDLIISILKVGVIIIGLVSLSSFFFAKSIANPLSKSVNFTKSVAMGDFSADIDILQQDEIGVLAGELRNMQGTIRNVLKSLDDQIWAIQEGGLDFRGDAKVFEGGWRALIAGINQLVETLVGHIDNIPIATLITDKEFNIRYVSQAGLDMIGGMEREQVIGQKCYDLFKTSICGIPDCTSAKAMQNESNACSETDAHPADKEFYLSTIGVPIKNAADEITAAMEIMVDHTAIHNAMDNAGETASGLLDSVQDLTVSSQEISSTSNQQAAAVKEIVSTMEDSDQLARSIASKIEHVTEMTKSTKQVVNNGVTILQDSLSKMQEIQGANTKTISEMKALGNKIESIWDIVNMINGVADQTKIIAFNAELEASSAGEAGKNFQIVASEIRRLADSTVASTNEIKSKIDEIQQSSDNLVTTSEGETLKITEGWDLSKNLEKLFGEIRQSAEITDQSADQIALSINQQVSAFEQILQTLKQISEGIDSFVISTKSTTGAAEKLKEMANNLQSGIEEYSGS